MSVNQLLERLLPYDSVIFDLDNTLFDQLQYDAGAFRDIEDRFNQFSGLADYLIERKKQKGSLYKWLFNDAISKFKMSEDALTVMLALYKNHSGRNLQLNSRIREMLTELKTKEKRIFVVTNGHYVVQQRKIEQLDLMSLVDDYVICEKSKEDQLKPKPWSFFKLQEKYSLHRAVMVGDNPEVDGEYAKNVDIPYIEFVYTDKML